MGVNLKPLSILLFKYILNRITVRSIDYSTIEIAPCVEDLSVSSKSLATVIIPSRDNAAELSRCIESVLNCSKNNLIEIVIVDNGSVKPETISYLSRLRTEGHKVLSYNQRFNFSEMCNLGAKEAAGKLLIFLNDDTEVLSDQWINALGKHAFAPGIGVVGSQLRYPSGGIQHAGVLMGLNGLAGHITGKEGREKSFPETLRTTCYFTSAVTFAAAAIEADKFWAVGGLDSSFPVGLNDIDICLRLSSQKNLRSVVCCQARLLHLESSTRGKVNWIIKSIRFYKDISRFVSIHGFPQEQYFFPTNLKRVSE